MLNTPVHITSKLAIQTVFIQNKFGIQRRTGQGRCFLTQFAYAINAVTNIPVSRIVTHIDQYCEFFLNRKIDGNGHTLHELIDAIKVPIKTRDHINFIKTKTWVLNNPESLFDTIIEGLPILCILDRDVAGSLACEASTGVGISFGSNWLHDSKLKGYTDQYHCLLIVGLDADGYIIARDSRDMYAYNGYLKISYTLLKKGWDNIKMIALEVTEFKSAKLKKINLN